MQEKVPGLREQKPRKTGSRKLRFFLFLLFTVLLAVLFFRSSISKVSQIDITGNVFLPREEIGQAAGVAIGESYFTVRPSSVEERIRQLRAVRSVSVTKSFPGVVRIEVEEHPLVAYQFSASGEKEAVLANGQTFPAADAKKVMDKPVLAGWDDADPWKMKLCETLAQIPDKLLAEISEIRPSPTTTYEDKIKMYTRSQFEVYTTVTYLPDKIQYLEEMILQMREKEIESGVFELLEVNTHIPFELYYGSQVLKKTTQ